MLDHTYEELYTYSLLYNQPSVVYLSHNMKAFDRLALSSWHVFCFTSVPTRRIRARVSATVPPRSQITFRSHCVLQVLKVTADMTDQCYFDMQYMRYDLYYGYRSQLRSTFCGRSSDHEYFLRGIYVATRDDIVNALGEIGAYNESRQVRVCHA